MSVGFLRAKIKINRCHYLRMLPLLLVMHYLPDYCYAENITNSGDEDSLSLFKHSMIPGKKSLRPFPETGLIKSKFLDNLTYSGVIDFISFFRAMSTQYPGTTTLKKDLEFTPYPVVGQLNGNYYRQPLINLIVAGKPSDNTSFAVEYAMSDFYLGTPLDSGRKLSVQNLFQFHGSVHTDYGNFLLTAGGGAMNLSLSPLTLYNKDFREPMFEKTPWDWYTNSFQKYKDQFHSSTVTTPSYIVNTATQGFILEGTDLPGNIQFTGFYGRTNFTVSPVRAYNGFPAQLAAGKITKGTDSTGKIGFNFYDQFGYTNSVNNIKDQRKLATVDFSYKNSKIKFYTEDGIGQVVNPSNSSKPSEAITAALTILNRKINLPIFLQAYSIGANVAALESAALNANPTVVQGGYGASAAYNNGYYPAYLQEVGMIANNREGLIFKLNKTFKNFRIEVGNAISREKKNLFNGLSFEHMDNAFMRSRFDPWYQGGGPYGQTYSRYRRTFQTLTITDTLQPYKKYFNAAELRTMAKFHFLKRGLILDNYLYAGTVGKSLSAIPAFNSGSFLRMFYEELSAYYHIQDQVTLLLFCLIQRSVGNNETSLAPEDNKPTNQTGTGFGFGIDYDFAPNAGLFIRHRWVSSTDANYALDRFKGQQTIVELKLFF